MIKLKNLLSEIPITHHGNIGDFEKGSSFTHKTDRMLVTHPVAVKKIKDFLKNTSADFDFYFVNTKHARKHTEVGKVSPSFVFDELHITPDQLKDGRIDSDHITVFFTNNKGAERMPLTPWIIAHRFGHVVRRLYSWDGELAPWLDRILDSILSCYGVTPVKLNWGRSNYDVYRSHQIAKRHLCETIGTFKSARDKNLREEFEFHHELFAQYLNTGKITLNPLPDVLLIGHGAFGHKNVRRLQDQETANEYLRDIINDYNYYAEQVLSECVGSVFVM